MGYVICYFLIGLLLVIVKSPIRDLVDEAMRKLKVNYLIDGGCDVPIIKSILFRICISTFLILIYPCMLYVALKEKNENQKIIQADSCKKPESHISWLQNKISIQDAEAKHLVLLDGRVIPFGHVYNQWKTLLSNMRDGDELHEFCSSDESWEFLAGREGIALVRNGEIITDIVTKMN